METNNTTYILMGCKSCGKSTQGNNLSKEFKVPFFDTDTLIEKMVDMPVREYYTKKGGAAFMQAEEEVCKKLASEYAGQKIVISTGGGICENAPALNELKALGQFVFLKLSIEVSVSRIMKRITENADGEFQNVPSYIMVKNPKSLEEIRQLLTERFEERTKKYASIADITVEIKEASRDENFKSIIEALKQN